MYIKNLRARAEKRFDSDRLELRFWSEDRMKGKVLVVTGFTTVEIDPATIIQPGDETILLDYEEAQAFMDSMWNAGVRPTDERQTSQVVKIMYERIEDLKRTIVFLETLVHRFTNPILNIRSEDESRKS